VTTDPPRLRVVANGPLTVEGVPLAWLVKGEPVQGGLPRWGVEPSRGAEPPYALCRCDRSSTKPFCDRWPDRLPCFDEPSRRSTLTPVFTWAAPEEIDGPLVALKPNGPIRVSGGVSIEQDDGTTFDAGERVSLCRCGRSGVMPYCDGSHKEVGFSDG